MKKETVIAISMGIVFGLAFSFIVILNTQKNKKVTQKQQTQKKVAADVIKNVAVEPLVITSPENAVAVDKKEITIKGSTEKGSFVVVQTQITDLTATAVDGNFSVKVPLALGENIIHVSSYPKGTIGKVQEKEIKIYYLAAN